jgi:hypothetical protein
MTASADRKTRELYEFGPFRLDPEKNLLLREDEIVSIAPKAFQILMVLISHNKQVVTKDVQLVPDRELNVVVASHSNVEIEMEETRPWGWIAATAVLLVAVIAGAWKLRQKPERAWPARPSVSFIPSCSLAQIWRAGCGKKLRSARVRSFGMTSRRLGRATFSSPRRNPLICEAW